MHISKETTDENYGSTKNWMSINGSISTYAHNRCNHIFKYILTCKTAVYHINSINRDHVSIPGMHLLAFCIFSQAQSKMQALSQDIYCTQLDPN